MISKHFAIYKFSDVYFADGDVTQDTFIIPSFFFPNRSHEGKKAKMASNRAGFMECKQTHGKEMTKKGPPTKQYHHKYMFVYVSFTL